MSPSALRSEQTDLRADALDAYRPALLGYCYRMLGSAVDADDAVQETVVRAWRGLDGFEGRGPLEAWLYRIATNVCLNLLRGRRRRALPIDLGPAERADAPLGAPRPGGAWVEPLPDAAIASAAEDPADAAARRESVRLAFVAALQLLPPRQRAVLILRDVLRWRAAEVADLLDTTTVSVKSALQRARATLATNPLPPGGPTDADLLGRYLDAFGRFDIDALVRLLRDDATMAMPPFPLWIRGRDEIAAFLPRVADSCTASRFVPLAVNGTMGAAQLRPGERGGPLAPFAVHVIEAIDGRVSAIHVFHGDVAAGAAVVPDAP